MNPEELNEVKKITEVLLQKMTIADAVVEVLFNDTVLINIHLVDPQFLIGRDGQTLIDLQRILKVLISKKLGKMFYPKVDINDYQKQKIDHLKKIATSIANEVAITREKKFLPPMTSYERRVIHEELANRQDVVTQSQGEGEDRRIVIIAK